MDDLTRSRRGAVGVDWPDRARGAERAADTKRMPDRPAREVNPADAEQTPSVIVIGAGVSGCACGAALASAGLNVTLMNSAMDRVGLPAYGPDIIGQTGDSQGLNDALNGLPDVLRSAWFRAATKPASGEAILNIDRRSISIETKRALESIPGLEFRQGLVTDLRLVDDDLGFGQVPDEKCASETARARVLGRAPGQRVEVETIFGEVFRADAAVVAVGLSLGAHSASGTDSMPSGRYGEPASAGLLAAFEKLGLEFDETCLEVGPRVSARNATVCGWLRRPATVETGAEEGERSDCDGTCRRDAASSRVAYMGGPGQGLPVIGGIELGESEQAGANDPNLRVEEPEVQLVPAVLDSSENCWPAGYPPAPHWQADLRVDRMVIVVGTTTRRVGARVPGLSPDGAATSEMYVAPVSLFAKETAAAGTEAASPITSRMPLTVKARTVRGASDAGRVSRGGEPEPVWVVGRSAGARDYAASLASGVRAASDIARFFAGRANENTSEGASGGLAASEGLGHGDGK